MIMYATLWVVLLVSIQGLFAQCPDELKSGEPTSKDCRSAWNDQHVRINQLQFIGTHNSYHLAIDPVVMSHFARMNPTLAQEVDYASHLTLTEQLNLGLRQLEIDAFYDPEGGRFADPMGEHWIAQASGSKTPLKPNPKLLQPGFKVLHMPDVDYRSTCLTYVDCLREIKAWSDQHPGHLPMFVHGNAKGPAKPGSSDILKQDAWTQVQALPFDDKAFRSLDREVLSVFPRSRLIEPEDVIRSEPGLGEGIAKNGWPLLSEARGKVMFVIDGSEKQAKVYEAGDLTMRGRVYFVDSHAPATADAGYTVVIDARGHIDEVRTLVLQGEMVRTLADFLTVEPRTGDTSRGTAAFSSGAQIVSTDYYRADPKFPFAYHLTGFDGGHWFRCNPVNAPAGCDERVLDPYVR